MTIVIDTSVTMAWCFEDEETLAADEVLDRLRDGDAAVPSLWQLEVANVLLVAERRGRISEAQAERFVSLLEQLPIRVDADVVDVTSVLGVGRRHGLSAYDACYLVLAERLGAPLATLNAALAAAGRAAGVTVLADD
ncbi:MAG: type II toxin-antitoxin system VapC family toxin [Actinobacteria bacterium]|nr:type II toxin-antitoxin system VapC family toxin [Actinomycetota bacterium]